VCRLVMSNFPYIYFMLHIVPTAMRRLALLILLISFPLSARAQQGCPDHTDEALSIIGNVVGVLNTPDFDFRALPAGASPLGSYSPSNIQALCNTMRQNAPAEDTMQKISFFDVTTHFLAVTHVVDPNPSDDIIVSGLNTVVVFDRSGNKIAAISF
jgi:hypothetical protein